MRIKCRGYEGDFISIKTDVFEVSDCDCYRCRVSKQYEITLLNDDYAIITLKRVEENEIEFVEG